MSNEIINEKNYSFYMFKCNDPEIINTYVGSTQNFRIRKSSHKHDCNTETRTGYDLQVYKIIRQNGGWSNWKMVQIHEQICKSRTHSKQIEQGFIEKNNADMNTHRAFISEEQRRAERLKYDAEHADEIRKCRQKYYIEHIDKIRENEANRPDRKEYYKKYDAEHANERREKDRKYNAENVDKNKERCQKYNAENADKIREQQRKYRAENVDKIREQQRKYRAEKKQNTN